MPDTNVRETIERIEAGLAQHENDCTCSAVIPNDAHCPLTELGITLTDILSVLALAKRADEAERVITKALEWLRLSDEAMSPATSFSQVEHAVRTLSEYLAALNAKEPA